MGGRVVEGTGLENRQARKRLEGSNPSPSAIYVNKTLKNCGIIEICSIILPMPRLIGPHLSFQLGRTRLLLPTPASENQAAPVLRRQAASNCSTKSTRSFAIWA